MIEAVIGADSLADRPHRRAARALRALRRQPARGLPRGERITERLRACRCAPATSSSLQGDLRFCPRRCASWACCRSPSAASRLGSAAARIDRRSRSSPRRCCSSPSTSCRSRSPSSAPPCSCVLFGALPIREAYSSIEWPILVMLGALIPVSDALRTTGAHRPHRDWLSHVAGMLPPAGARRARSCSPRWR